MISTISTKGYSIPFTSLSESQLHMHKKNLTIEPIILGNDITPKKFIIWRESKTMFYMPRFYGLKHFGIPSKISLPSGNTIDVHFKGALRPIQIPIVEKTVAHFLNLTDTGESGALLELYCAIGKTVCALNIVSRLQCKTLIIVHKEFLMNQWIERAAEFLPNVRIGIIQGKIFDIEDKDIVIGMVQTMHKTQYPSKTFDSFGLTIFDEVHRFGSECFSKIFFRVSTRYMLGITATMKRKDGTSPLLQYFIGPIIYTITDREKENVIVLGIPYINEKDGGLNAKYLTVERDFRDKVKYSTMIGNVCSYTPRTKAIFNIVVQVVQKYPSSQIMILSHNLCLLRDFEMIHSKNKSEIPLGYYVGGMKQTALDETQHKQIILATFSMAQEALDIKTLSILILASSKTDIVQSVGRILRERNNTPKMVIDIIDSNDTFLNQWKKRFAYYKKCDYNVFKTSIYNKTLIHDFFENNECWTQLYPRKPSKKCSADDVSDSGEDSGDDGGDDGGDKKPVPSLISFDDIDD